MRRLISTAVIVATTLIIPAVTAAPALAESPWFHLTSGARPTHLRPGTSTNNVQEVTVTGSTGTFCLGPNRESAEAEIACMPDGSEASLVEAELKSHTFPNRSLAVTREANLTSSRYVITFPGQELVPMWTAETIEEFEFGEAQELTQVAQGAPDGQLVVTAYNLGDGTAEGKTTTINIADTLPAGFRPVSIEAIAGAPGGSHHLGPVQCTLAPLACTFERSFPPYYQIEVRIGVSVEGQATPGEQNQVTISGGGAPEAHVARTLSIDPSPTPFGLQALEVTPEEVGGAADTRAGSHPFQLTTTIELNQLGFSMGPTLLGQVEPVANPRDLSFKLPSGLVGNLTALPACSLAQFAANTCPPRTIVGAASIAYSEPRAVGVNMKPTPVFNVEPALGEPARFGLLPNSEAPILLDTSVRTGGDYGVTVSASSITQEIGLLSTTVTLWGVPGDPRHDRQRGEGCFLKAVGRNAICNPLEESQPPAFLTMPTSCNNAPLEMSMEGDSWADPTHPISLPATQPLPTLDGCNRIPFDVSASVALGDHAGSTPSGLSVDIHVGQDAVRNASGLAPSDVRNIAVSLPEGVALNPSAADGLQACTPSQIALSTNSDPTCPDASKIANVTIHSPVLPDPLKGFVYLASPQNFAGMPQENPFGSLVAMYLVAKDPVSGVLVKLAGRVSLSDTGQVTTTLEDNPQLPFEDAELEFFGGDRAPIASPPHCGSYTTNAAFTPWSGGEPVTSSPSFEVTTGPHGTPCPGSALPFAPSLTAGTPNVIAGSFAPLTTTVGREDGNQDLQSLQLHYPAGLSGILAGVALCPEAKANAGTCGAESEIGETTASIGLGGDPYTVTGGKVYLTEKYQGAPFGLSIVTPAKAGPFVLQEGKPVVVRARIEVDPTTAALTITTGAIPRIIEGFPLQIKHVNVTINRPGFTFNPTNCEPLSITGAIDGGEGAGSPASVPLQVTNCAALKFAPRFTASTQGNGTFNRNGASLKVNIATDQGPKANPAVQAEANIKKVDVALPVQLPSRLSTLQKACTEKQFAANPAGCPEASNVGSAVVHTPVLPVALTGPAYLVSHGNAAFPDLDIILQGDGVTIVLDGKTDIKKGITFSRFDAAPDAPISSFELNLPEGKFSVLAANGNLCKATTARTVKKRVAIHRHGRTIHVLKKVKRQVAVPLAMPTTITAQNGAVLTQTTKIAVTGCAKPKAKKAKKARRAQPAGHHR